MSVVSRLPKTPSLVMPHGARLWHRASLGSDASPAEPAVPCESAGDGAHADPARGDAPDGQAGSGLLEALARVAREDPHCAQLSAPLARAFAARALGPRRLEEDDRFVSPSWPRMPYRRRSDAERSSCHWGQLKLLESEMKCLVDFMLRPSSTWCPGSEHLVVYAGAAPGLHIMSLLQRFPCCRFELYDPAPFDEQLVEFAASADNKGRLVLSNVFFDNHQAQRIAAERNPSVFFSDIRTADPTQMAYEEVECSVGRDMLKQKEWVKILRPRVSVLKFRLPWEPGATSYPRGRIMVQAFPPCTSTEGRLIVPLESLDEAEVPYDHEEYGEQLMHHNTVSRACRYAHEVQVAGLDHCYDCAALVETVHRYLEAKSRFGHANDLPAGPVAAEQVAAEIRALVAEIGRSGRTLQTAYHVSSSRHSGRQFSKRRFCDDEGKDHFAEVEPSQHSRNVRGRMASANQTWG
eukprot:CAMPEP_0168368772 /NCGR_PEP_ID=MMETSP0228-20121227/6420_1 /TAXON_ID=133427 /ORGANISM="Protoceratium reticulatum, Strain CCCM 535 (=CCMP 1889)" /LENGTH=463 /DNA_ID=CAMNT_0008381623 /DNA_START=24 /DNA_END=1415 /DNA_ORIENTATION=+